MEHKRKKGVYVDSKIIWKVWSTCVHVNSRECVCVFTLSPPAHVCMPIGICVTLEHIPGSKASYKEPAHHKVFTPPTPSSESTNRKAECSFHPWVKWRNWEESAQAGGRSSEEFTQA